MCKMSRCRLWLLLHISPILKDLNIYGVRVMMKSERCDCALMCDYFQLHRKISIFTRGGDGSDGNVNGAMALMCDYFHLHWKIPIFGRSMMTQWVMGSLIFIGENVPGAIYKQRGNQRNNLPVKRVDTQFSGFDWCSVVDKNNWNWKESNTSHAQVRQVRRQIYIGQKPSVSCGISNDM